MAKVLYAIKLWLFCQQFKLTTREEKGVRPGAFADRVFMLAAVTGIICYGVNIHETYLIWISAA